MRIYVPVSVEQLRAHHDAGAIPQAVERFVAPDDTEEGEYAALMSAADASRAAGSARRVVIVADVGANDVDAAVEWRLVEALHADVTDGADEDDDLAWFAPQELDDLLGGLASG